MTGRAMIDCNTHRGGEHRQPKTSAHPPTPNHDQARTR